MALPWSVWAFIGINSLEDLVDGAVGMAYGWSSKESGPIQESPPVTRTPVTDLMGLTA